MNEPANQNDQIYHCPQNKYDYPAVRTKALYGNGVRELGHKTLCMTTKQGDHNEYLHYDVHSLYGLTETMATQKAIHAATGKRGFAVSRSTYVSSGRYGTHWLGDNFSVWDNMKFSIIGILEFNMFGINFDMNEPANQNDDVYHCPQNKYDYPAIRTSMSHLDKSTLWKRCTRFRPQNYMYDHQTGRP
ncbi:sucrase-isomaltase, intestinal-like [Oppia nitens]|uniref:sucrase-isomaltase, intestinal-like n=1 Tax=Oppia nitens TaxID=1686743 RepID=UPI0023D9CA16|nr:sucrase-isomaltase, intestinal-like [Oppia nitens]